MLHIIRFYQRWISPLLAPRCRYYPTCSNYAVEAITQFGTRKGLWLSVKRVARCHPFGSSGYDPVIKEAAGESADTDVCVSHDKGLQDNRHMCEQAPQVAKEMNHGK